MGFGIPQSGACCPAAAHAAFAETSCLAHDSCLQHIALHKLGVPVSKTPQSCSPWTMHQPGLGSCLLQTQELMQAFQAMEVGSLLGLPGKPVGTTALGSVFPHQLFESVMFSWNVFLQLMSGWFFLFLDEWNSCQKIPVRVGKGVK